MIFSPAFHPVRACVRAYACDRMRTCHFSMSKMCPLKPIRTSKSNTNSSRAYIYAYRIHRWKCAYARNGNAQCMRLHSLALSVSLPLATRTRPQMCFPLIETEFSFTFRIRSILARAQYTCTSIADERRPSYIFEHHFTLRFTVHINHTLAMATNSMYAQHTSEQ